MFVMTLMCRQSRISGGSSVLGDMSSMEYGVMVLESGGKTRPNSY